MGYMGFGMQKWIYSRNPRKPFAKGRIPSFTALDTYDRKFKLQPSKPFGRFFLYISILLLGLLFSIIYLKKDEFLIYSNKIQKQKNERLLQVDKEAFKFLMSSGKYRLEVGNIIGAYSEFKLAVNIKPKDTELNQIMLETLSILCYNDEKYCVELDVFMQNE